MDIGSGNGIEDRWNGEHAAVQIELALYMRFDLLVFSRLQLIRLALAAQTEFPDLLLHGEAGELRVVQFEIAL